ncbi:hypothetical protein [Metabacillus iocasae]|uniref:Uncharacterized protein n=1 Tax=Priestia iocasae TaxID=2291674 RepID=A0ABS2QRM7_9BACI|nr:hypothetical protein [Metabacillus iocasae]MBM7702099.1 hypothetical protein [Metabacillus iocasae]
MNEINLQFNQIHQKLDRIIAKKEEQNEEQNKELRQVLLKVLKNLER